MEIYAIFLNISHFLENTNCKNDLEIRHVFFYYCDSTFVSNI